MAKHENEMDRIEDLILVGSPVTTAGREAWRRWAKGSSYENGRQQWVAPFSDVLEAFVLQEAVEIPQLQFIVGPRQFLDKEVDVPVAVRVVVPKTAMWIRSWHRATDHGGNHEGD